MNADDAAHIRELIAVNQRRLRKLEVQAAALGAHCPAPILVEIDETREKIASFEGQIDDRVIQSYLEGRKTAHGFTYDLDAIEHKLNQVVVQETRVYRFFGIPVFSVSTVITRVFTLFFALIGVAFVSAVFGLIAQAAALREQHMTATSIAGTVTAVARFNAATQASLAITATSSAANATAISKMTATAGAFLAELATFASKTELALVQTTDAEMIAVQAQTSRAQTAIARASVTSTPTVRPTLRPTQTRTPTELPTIEPPTLEPATLEPPMPTETPLLTETPTQKPSPSKRPTSTPPPKKRTPTPRS